MDEIHKLVEQSFKELELKLKNSNTSTLVISNYFVELRAQIDLHREQIIEKINQESQELIAILYEEENKYIRNIQNLDNRELKDIIKSNEEIESLKSQFSTNLNLNQNEAKDLLDKINKFINDISEFENKSLMNKIISFLPIKYNRYLGELTSNSYKLSNDFGKIIKSFNEHKKCVQSIQINNDSNKLISSSEDETIKIWDLHTGECLKTLFDHSNEVTSILINNKNDEFISGSTDGTIKIWNLNDYKCIKTLNNESEVYSLLLLSDDFLAAGLKNSSINIWNINQNKIIKSLEAHSAWVLCLTKTNDCTKLISGSEDNYIKIWDLETFDLLKELTGVLYTVTCLKILKDGHLLSSSMDKKIRLWNIDLGECLQIINLNDWIYCFETFNNDQMLIIGIGKDVMIYDLNENEVVNKYLAHTLSVSGLILLSNGKLVTASGSSEIKLWNLLKSESF